jgi:IclR family mhp operon transcriptional activator
MGFTRRPGFRFPVLMTSMGRAYLAFCGADTRERIIATLAAVPGPSTDLARHPRILGKLIAETRERGYAVMDDRYSREVFNNKVWALGVPIRDERQVFASINMMMLRNAVPQDEGIKQFFEPLQRAAASIAEILIDKTRGKAYGPVG